ncbi:MAG: transposase [Cenarchaeum sp. SB0666_bin_15]|nr:transposase [Cenarchaeum sp. SB0666_bin_15]MYB47038.1 transposase [Cenarchaeum sp. SB0662_bin_33]
MRQASDKDHNEEITLTKLIKMFPDNKTAENWFEANIWKDGRKCPRCQHDDTLEGRHLTMPYYCSLCKTYFSVRIGTVMQHSKIGYQQWAIATYQFMINGNGISSMKLHRDLGITQKSAWFMVQKLRESWQTLAGIDNIKDTAEVDKEYVGNSESNKNVDKKG